MTKKNQSSAARLESAATQHQVSKVVEQNNEREARLMARSQSAMSPMAVLEHKLEAFFETILGEARYLAYMNRYQQMRSEILDQWESAVAESELKRGVAEFNLVNASGAPLGTAS